MERSSRSTISRDLSVLIPYPMSVVLTLPSRSPCLPPSYDRHLSTYEHRPLMGPLRLIRCPQLTLGVLPKGKRPAQPPEGTLRMVAGAGAAASRSAGTRAPPAWRCAPVSRCGAGGARSAL